jgi:hypothetical protein
MDSRLAAARPEAGAGQTTFRVLAAREMRRFVLNPIFLAAAGLTAVALWSAHLSTVTEIDGANTISAVFSAGSAWWPRSG